MTLSTKKAPNPPFITVDLVLGLLTYKGSEVSVLGGLLGISCRLSDAPDLPPKTYADPYFNREPVL
jgi:hypothetical protein